MKRVTVYNEAISPIERAGRLFPARATSTVDVHEDRFMEIKAARHLVIIEQDSDEQLTENIVSTDSTDEDFTELTVAQLRERATELGLSVDGLRKQELVDTLATALQGRHGEAGASAVALENQQEETL